MVEVRGTQTPVALDAVVGKLACLPPFVNAREAQEVQADGDRSPTLSVQEAARKFQLNPATVRRLLRQGRIAGMKNARGAWRVPAEATRPPILKASVPWSIRELRRIYSSSARLTANVESAHIREMIRRGFFGKGVWRDELDKLVPVAREIVNEQDASGQTLLATDPLFWGRAKQILDIAARILGQRAVLPCRASKGR